jgi:hypothetical protein
VQTEIWEGVLFKTNFTTGKEVALKAVKFVRIPHGPYLRTLVRSKTFFQLRFI